MNMPKIGSTLWVVISLAAAGIGFMMHILVFADLACGTTIKQDANMPSFAYTALFLIECVGMSSVLTPMLVCIAFIDEIDCRRTYAIISMWLLIGLTTMLTIGWTASWVGRYGGQYLEVAMSRLHGASLQSLAMTTIVVLAIYAKNRYKSEEQ